MIDWISNWAGTIIVSVIIATIIEMILPGGSSKKYIKVVIGIYILFTIISPVVTKFTKKTITLSDFIELNEYIEDVKEKENLGNSLDKINESDIKEIYVKNLKSDIKNKLKGKGYKLLNIGLDIENDDNYTLNKINIKVIKEEEKEKSKEEKEEEKNLNNDIEVINEISVNIVDINYDEKNNNSNNKDNLSSSEKNKIKEYLSSVYEISDKNIFIND